MGKTPLTRAEAELRVIGYAPQQIVDARDLHSFLGVGKDFATWIKDRVKQYEFKEDVDFTTFITAPQNGGAGNRGVRTDYALSLDMAKELCMVERNEKGKQARQYFIECERRAKAATVQPAPASLSRMQLIEIAMEAERERLVLEAKVEAMQPDVIAFNRIAKAEEGSVSVTEAAKALQIPPKKLFELLSLHRWIYRRAGGKNWLAYQDRLHAGLLEHKVTTITRNDGAEKMVEQVLVTPRGMARLAKNLGGSALAS